MKVLQPVRLSDPYHSVANRSHIHTHMSFGRRLHLENTRTALDGAWGVERFIRATKVSAAWNSRKHRLGLSLRPLRVPLPCFHPNYARIHRYQISRHVLRRDHGFKLTRRLGEARQRLRPRKKCEFLQCGAAQDIKAISRPQTIQGSRSSWNDVGNLFITNQ